MIPDGLRILVVDDDRTCLHILHKMLLNCLYQVTKCSGAAAALKILRENKEGFDIVISDVHMPDMDGFKLLQHIGLEIDLPVVMMSADDSKNVVLKGILHGACDYLIKPVRMEALQYIWQHVVRRKKDLWKDMDIDQLGIVVDLDGEYAQKASDDFGTSEGNCKNSKRKDEDDDDEEKDPTTSSSSKKPRVTWTHELHLRFVRAVELIGFNKAVPKKILDLMNEPTLTRENIASHLQKYRLYLKKLSMSRPPEMSPFAHRDMPLGMMSTRPCLPFRRPLMPSSHLLPLQNLGPNFPVSMPSSMDPVRSTFGAGSCSGIRFTEQQPNINYRPGPLLGGIPLSNVGPNQPSFGPRPQRSTLLPQQHQPSSSYFSQPVLPQQSPCVMPVPASRPSTSKSQCLDTFPATTNPRMMAPVSTGMSQEYQGSSMTAESMMAGGSTKTAAPISTGMSQDFIPNYGVFDTLGIERYNGRQQHAVPTGFSSNNNELGNGIKSGNHPVFDNTPFSSQLDQEDLCSFFNEHQEGATLFDSDFNLDGILFDDLPM